MKKLVVLAALLIVAACGVKKADQEISIVEEGTAEETVATPIFEDIEELITARPVYRASETIRTDLIHTKLEVNFDWKQSRMNGVATITAKPHFYASDNLILDAKTMVINSVKMNGKALHYTYEDDFLDIKLGKTFSRDDNYTVVIDYVAQPEEREAGGSRAITSDRGLYFINPMGEDENKMPQIWTQGETEASSVWFPTIDSPNAKTTQEIFITVDDKYVTLSNGRMVSSKSLAGGKRVDHWKQDLPHAPYLFMMAVGEFKIVKDSYTRLDGSKMEVNYYVEPEWESSARHIFGETPEMIEYFSKLLGVEYPWDKYHQIVARDYVSGAMENTGAVIFGDFVYKSERELLDGNDQSTIAHELFHHWFGDLVTCESWSNLPLNESFANYSQYLWDEHRYGSDEADYNAEIEADGYYQTAGMQGYHDLIWLDYKDKDQMFDGHSYNKGGRILHMLRNYLGDEAFFAGINNYLVKNKFKPAEFHQLRIAFEEVSGEDLNWFFNQWFLGSGHPTLNFKAEENDTSGVFTLTIEQTQDLELSPIYKLPIEVALFDDKGKHIHKLMIDELSEEFKLPYSGHVKGVIYDHQQMLLAKSKEDKTTEQYIYQFYHGERYGARRDGLMKGSKDKGEQGQQLILDAMSDPFWNIRLLAIGKVGRLKEDRRDKGLSLLKEMSEKDPDSRVRVAALNALSKRLEGEELIAVYKICIQNDRSYAVVSAALRNLGKEDPDEAMLLAENLESEKSSKMITGIVQLYAGHGGPEKYDFIEAVLKGNAVQGFDKLGVMNSFTFYLTRQEPELIDRAFAIYVDQSEHGSFYMSMFLPQNISYLEAHFATRIAELNKELLEFEENNDALYADQTRKKIAAYEALQVKYAGLTATLEKKSGDHQMIIQGKTEDD
ncbi:MAG: HEAT repeat domain-containing protein [Crocinitomicaceae bacterium]|nr:HEAT repeat domain-containing protein [Crocinitomicaceae bacterium]